jgi:hypothetical protein
VPFSSCRRRAPPSRPRSVEITGIVVFGIRPSPSPRKQEGKHGSKQVHAPTCTGVCAHTHTPTRSRTAIRAAQRRLWCKPPQLHSTAIEVIARPTNQAPSPGAPLDSLTPLSLKTQPGPRTECQPRVLDLLADLVLDLEDSAWVWGVACVPMSRAAHVQLCMVASRRKSHRGLAAWPAAERSLLPEITCDDA